MHLDEDMCEIGLRSGDPSNATMVRRHSGGDGRTWRATPAMAVVKVVTAMTGAGGAVNAAQAELLTAWSFENFDRGDAVVESDFGDGILDLGSLASVATAFQGTTENAPFDWRAGDALAFVGPAPEGGGMTLYMDGLDVNDRIEVSMAVRRSPTGARWLDAEYWDGWGWTPVRTFDLESTWTTHAFEIPRVPETGRLFVRLTAAGFESPGGTVRFDNLRIDTMVPGHGGLTAALLGGLLRRRYRRE